MTMTEIEPKFVPVQTRSERFKSSDVADFAAITGREAEWRYTPAAPVNDLVDSGLLGEHYGYTITEADGVDARWVGMHDAHVARAGLPEERASAAAWSGTRDALLITIDGEIDRDIVLTRQDLGTRPRAAHTVVHVAPNTVAKLILRNTGQAKLAENVEFVVEDGARLTVVTVQEWDDDAIHLATHFAAVARDAHFKHVSVTLGGRLVRLNPSVHLTGPGSDVELFGAYFADSGQHIEHQVYVFHDGPHQKSRVTYKGALQGKSAHTVWIGDVLIGQRAIGTDSYEQNRNLVLTQGAQADSVPNLEIEIGDIVGAGHASATGRFDDEQLFYLQSRGITDDEARRLVVRGFLIEIVQRIGSPELEDHLQTAIEAELAGGAPMPGGEA
jgi:Fe-S cluster assembly protein SufD